MNQSQHHAHAAVEPPPSVLGAPPALALGAAPSGLVWWGLGAAPRGVTWTGGAPAGSDGAYGYTRVYGHGPAHTPAGVARSSNTYAMIRATPRPGMRAATVDYYYVAAPPAARASSLGQPPSTLGQPYDGTPDSPYPPSGEGWFETTYEDEGARDECASLLGFLPVNHYTDRFIPSGLYRIFAFEGASGSKTVSALRYWGQDASTLGADPNIPPGGNPNNTHTIAAAQELLTSLSQNGCIVGVDPAVLNFQNAYNNSGLGPPISQDGYYGADAQNALQIVLDSVNPPAGTAPAWCVGPRGGSNQPPGGGGGGGIPSIPTIVVAGRDFYDTLSTAQQAAFRSSLYAQISSGSCPGLDMSTITSSDSLVDSGNRAGAVGCFQLANAVGSQPGILDQATYTAVMAKPGGAPAPAAGVSKASMYAVGGTLVALAGLGIAVATGHNPFKLMKP